MVGSALGAVALAEVSTWRVRSWVADARWRPGTAGRARRRWGTWPTWPGGTTQKAATLGPARTTGPCSTPPSPPCVTRRRHPGYLILHEPIATQLALGVAVVLVGVALTRRKVSPKQIVVPGTESVHSRLSPGACGKKLPPAEQPAAKATTRGAAARRARRLDLSRGQCVTRRWPASEVVERLAS